MSHFPIPPQPGTQLSEMLSPDYPCSVLSAPAAQPAHTRLLVWLRTIHFNSSGFGLLGMTPALPSTIRYRPSAILVKLSVVKACILEAVGIHSNSLYLGNLPSLNIGGGQVPPPTLEDQEVPPPEAGE